jgi:putative transposase
MIPVSESHLRVILESWISHYNRGRPHISLVPGVPDPPTMQASVQHQKSQHRLGEGLVVHAESVLGGLHHEYAFVAAVA